MARTSSSPSRSASPPTRLNLLLALTLLLLAPLAALADSPFDFYPSTAVPCLDDADSKSNCPGELGDERNECLCTNGGDFVVNAAKCVGQDAADQVQQVYSTMSRACLDSKTQLTVSQADFLALADGSKDSLSSSTATSSSPPTSTSSAAEKTNTSDKNDDEGSSGGGLSTGAIAGIGAGAGVLAIAIIGGLITFCIRRRRRDNEESHPMLPTDQQQQLHHQQYAGAAGSTTFPPTEPSPGLTPQFDKDPKSAARWSTVSGLSPSAYSPSMTANTVSPPPTNAMMQSWGSAPQGWHGQQQQQQLHPGQYAGAYATPPIAELPPQSAGQVYEMDGGHQQGNQYAAELPAEGHDSHGRR